MDGSKAVEVNEEGDLIGFLHLKTIAPDIILNEYLDLLRDY